MDRTVIHRYDRFGAAIDTIHIITATHDEGIDGSDELQITCYNDLQKGDLLLWMDESSVWHEHMVDTARRTRDGMGAAITTATCVGSLATLWRSDTSTAATPMTHHEGAHDALERALAGQVLWSAGWCDGELGAADNTPGGRSAREELTRLAELYGAEIEPVIQVDSDTGDITRAVQLRVARGSDTQYLFTYSRDMASVERSIEDTEVYTAVHAYGAESNGTRISVDVSDDSLLPTWGQPDGRGGMAHSWTSYEDSNIDNVATLQTAAQQYLRSVSQPHVSYTVEVASIRGCIGDRVRILDEAFAGAGRALELEGRITRIQRDLGGVAAGTITLDTWHQHRMDVYDRIQDAQDAADQAYDLAQQALSQGAAGLPDIIRSKNGHSYWDRATNNICASDAQGRVHWRWGEQGSGIYGIPAGSAHTTSSSGICYPDGIALLQPWCTGDNDYGISMSRAVIQYAWLTRLYMSNSGAMTWYARTSQALRELDVDRRDMLRLDDSCASINAPAGSSHAGLTLAAYAQTWLCAYIAATDTTGQQSHVTLHAPGAHVYATPQLSTLDAAIPHVSIAARRATPRTHSYYGIAGMDVYGQLTDAETPPSGNVDAGQGVVITAATSGIAITGDTITLWLDDGARGLQLSQNGLYAWPNGDGEVFAAIPFAQ